MVNAKTLRNGRWSVVSKGRFGPEKAKDMGVDELKAPFVTIYGGRTLLIYKINQFSFFQYMEYERNEAPVLQDKHKKLLVVLASVLVAVAILAFDFWIND